MSNPALKSPNLLLLVLLLATSTVLAATSSAIATVIITITIITLLIIITYSEDKQLIQLAINLYYNLDSLLIRAARSGDSGTTYCHTTVDSLEDCRRHLAVSFST